VTPALAKAVWATLVVLWYAIRYPFERRAKKAAVAQSRRDLRETALLAVSLTGLGLLPALYVTTGWPGFADRPFRPTLAWLGTAAALAALVMFRVTHKALGRNWSVSLDVRERHALVTDGVYRRVRHPMYTAFWLLAVAQALLLPNWIAGTAGLVGFGTLFFLRVGREERMMLDAFGDDYRAYVARTARVIPWIY
jgi:protein-S-isoprenylcysteine O-methyltransferase Ste14